mmetsp:Transcript_28741/g.54468  ORF Transcript_28741/g.54468 Transcript_28741/m.54468 type:complete len:200 (+) Transcript_28741:417-1016(+)
MRQRRQPCHMKRCQQHACGNAHAFRHIVILVPRAIVKGAIALGKDDDQPGRVFKMRLVCIGPNGLQRFDPFVTGTTGIELALFFFGSVSDLFLDGRVTDGHEMPRLVIGTGRGRARRSHTGLDHGTVHRLGGVVTHRVAGRHKVAILFGLFQHDRVAQVLPVGQGQLAVFKLVLGEHTEAPVLIGPRSRDFPRLAHFAE